MDIHAEPRPAARRAWGLCWGMLLALLYLLWPTGVAQAQAEPISYELNQQRNTPDPVGLNAPIQFTIYITNTGAIAITSLPLTYTFDSNYLTFGGAYPTPDSNNGAGQLSWNDIVASCANGFLAPGQICYVSIFFTAKADTSALPDQRTFNTVQSSSQQSSASVRIVAEVQKPVPLNPHSSWISRDKGDTKSVAWGDMDGDGDLDLAAGTGVAVLGTDGSPSKVYRNEGGVLQTSDPWVFAQIDDTWSVAWGDMDGDGDLDLAAGNWFSPNKVYRNEGGVLQTTSAAWVSADTDATYSVAWGDMDGDGDLDLAAGNAGSPSKVYRNEGGVLQTSAAWVSADTDNTYSVAWGDMDGDGDLDLATGNYYSPNKVYRNEGGVLQTSAAWTSADTDLTLSVAWGDMDGDGDLDLATGNSPFYDYTCDCYLGSANKVYRNEGGVLQTSAAWVSADKDRTWSVAWGDVDGDGDLDLAAGNAGSPSKVYRNEGGILQTNAAWVSDHTDNTWSVAWGDMDGDGDLDLAAGNGGPNKVYLNMRQGQHRLPNNAPAVTVTRPITPLLVSSAIAIPYTLFDPEGDAVGRIELSYSLNGGGQWRPAVATAATRTTNLVTANREAGGRSHIFTWDTFASGFFGQSDNVVLRLQVYPQPKQSASPNTYHYANRTPGLYQRPYASAVTFPFRVRGTQVRVMDNGSSSPQPTANARVYRLPVGQSGGAQPIRPGTTGVAYHTNSQGYLQGRGQLGIGDRLVALAPITATESYTLYYTSATPTLTGLNVYTVTTAGVQTLTVSSANPLLLFNLDVALEWDARKDTAFVEQLKFDLRRTAEFLFDATDGQAALGEITLYHNKEQWERADIRIYASNALIPNADPGGIVTSEVNEIIASNPFIGATTPYSITYQPGRIRMGAVWNRFGEATGTLGEDWPRTLAHEIGHYAFYLYDNYLGLKDGVVAPVDTCTGTMMADQYREDFSEFRTVDNWTAACGQTISAQRSGRADWQTITRFYPWLKMPGAQPNPGPVTLPLAVTQIESRFASTPTLPLDVAVFDLVDGNGAAQVSGPHAQAVLYTGDGRLLDLGHPVVDKLEARGAHVGDRLCVYDLPEKRLGCETITTNDNFLTLASRNDWQPEIVVSPVTSRTVSVLVSNVATGLPLKGKLYPENSPATTEIAFVPWPGNSYSTTFHLDAGVLAGHIQIWVEEAASAQNPRRESLTSYALGGSPGKLKKPPKGNKRSLELTTQAGSEDVTPAIAPDGQVLIYGNVSFTDGEFYALQKVNQLPAAPLWTTVVGDGYRILKSAKAPDLVNTSILFRYRGQDVPAGEENFLSLYFWNELAKRWDRLPTVLNRAVNEASAQAPGPGLYVLMSSLEIPLQQAGWNLLAYPVQQTRPVTAALASIAGNYSLVYSYVITDTVDPWKLYAPAAPAYVNDLQSLRFGQGYWINARQSITWLIKGPDQATLQAAATQSLPMPPATFYGVVLPGNGLTPAVGQPVQALINGVLCGQSQTQLFAGQIVYSLNVVGDGTGNPACIGAGQRVLITVAGLPLEEVFWQNDVAQPVVSNGPKIYLPTIWR